MLHKPPTSAFAGATADGPPAEALAVVAGPNVGALRGGVFEPRFHRTCTFHRWS